MHSTAFILRLDRKNAVVCINYSMMSGYTATKHVGVFRPFLAKLQITDSQLFLNNGTASIINLLNMKKHQPFTPNRWC